MAGNKTYYFAGIIPTVHSKISQPTFNDSLKTAEALSEKIKGKAIVYKAIAEVDYADGEVKIKKLIGDE